ncbi:MAG: hypothetical protein ACXVEE_24735 [Polyangiales bacterium]
MRIAALSLVSLLALSISACGGRVIEGPASDEATDDTGSAEVSGDGSSEIDSELPTDDSSIPIDDSGVVIDDTSVIIDDTSVIDDTGHFHFDTGPMTDSTAVDTGTLKDTGVIGSDTGTIKDSTATDTSVVDSATDTKPDTSTDSGPPITTVCDQFATATCTPAFQMCCTSKGLAWDDLGCSDVAKLYCDSSRDGVTAGKTVYDASYADACAAAWKSATTMCTLSLTDWIKNRVPCAQTFNGKTAPGGACTRDSDCHADAGEVAFCDNSSKRCRQYGVVPKGASCNYFGISPRICDTGLFCDYTTGAIPICKDATPLGGSCFGIDDQSCGLGNTCKSGKCAVGAPVGTTCTRDMECASWSCSVGKCTDPNVTLASKAFCSGA